MLKSAWRHRREDHSCEEISPCPYRGEILLEKRRFSNVNQIDQEFDPDRAFLTENSAPAEEGEQSAVTNYSPAKAEERGFPEVNQFDGNYKSGTPVKRLRLEEKGLSSG